MNARTNRVRKGIRTCNTNDRIWHSSSSSSFCRNTNSHTAINNAAISQMKTKQSVCAVRASSLYFFFCFCFFFSFLSCSLIFRIRVDASVPAQLSSARLGSVAASAHFPINNKIRCMNINSVETLRKIHKYTTNFYFLFYFYYIYFVLLRLVRLWCAQRE